MQVYFDRFAIALSGICAIHCIALPIVVSLIPFLTTTLQHGNLAHEFWFHQFILLFIVPVSVIAMISGYRCHKKLLPLVIAVIGLLFLSFTAIFAGTLIANNILPHEGEMWLTILGGVIHAAGHVLNVLDTRNIRLGCAI